MHNWYLEYDGEWWTADLLTVPGSIGQGRTKHEAVLDAVHAASLILSMEL